jgi:hypothetical protein
LTIRTEQTDRHDVAYLKLRWCEKLLTVTTPEEVATEDLLALRLRETASSE